MRKKGAMINDTPKVLESKMHKSQEYDLKPDSSLN